MWFPHITQPQFRNRHQQTFGERETGQSDHEMDSWNQREVYAAALDIFELNGVQLSKQASRTWL